MTTSRSRRPSTRTPRASSTRSRACSGCSALEHHLCSDCGSPSPSRSAATANVEAMIAQHARLARSLAEELGLDTPVLDALGASYERWDGKGWPGELTGAQIPLAARVIQVAEFVEVAHRDRGTDAAVAFAERAAATQFDPTVVACLRADPDKVFHGLDDVGSWGAVLDEEPVLHTQSIPQLDQALAAIGRFVDLKSPCTLGPFRGAREPGIGRSVAPRPSDQRPAEPAARRPYRWLRPARRVEQDLGQARPAHGGRMGTRATRSTARGADAAAISDAGPGRADRRRSFANASTAPATRPASRAPRSHPPRDCLQAPTHTRP